MSRIVNQLIQVTLGPGGTGHLVPVAFVYRREPHRIREIIDSWVMTEPWWDDANVVGRAPGEAHFYRVATIQGGVFEILREQTGKWLLWKSYD